MLQKCITQLDGDNARAHVADDYADNAFDDVNSQLATSPRGNRSVAAAVQHERRRPFYRTLLITEKCKSVNIKASSCYCCFARAPIQRYSRLQTKQEPPSS